MTVDEVIARDYDIFFALVDLWNKAPEETIMAKPNMIEIPIKVSWVPSGTTANTKEPALEKQPVFADLQGVQEGAEMTVTHEMEEMNRLVSELWSLLDFLEADLASVLSPSENASAKGYSYNMEMSPLVSSLAQCNHSILCATDKIRNIRERLSL